jgi:hypothetical protein
MDCPEKEALHKKCTAVWEAYEAEAKKAGLPANGPFPIPRTISELIRTGFHLDPQTGKPAISPTNSTAAALRREYVKALGELNRHLYSHRC